MNDDQIFAKQLYNMPEEFIIEMEEQKKARWHDIYEFMVRYFNCREEIEEAENDGAPIKDFLKKIHDFAFYGGINFALDPQIPYEKKYD